MRMKKKMIRKLKKIIQIQSKKENLQKNNRKIKQLKMFQLKTFLNKNKKVTILKLILMIQVRERNQLKEEMSYLNNQWKNL